MDLDDIVFTSSDPIEAKWVWAVIYGPQPRWWWCKYLPKSWRWAHPSRMICYAERTEPKCDKF